MERKHTRKPWRHATPKGPDIFDQWPAVGDPEPVEEREAAERLGLSIGGPVPTVPTAGDREKKSDGGR